MSSSILPRTAPIISAPRIPHYELWWYYHRLTKSAVPAASASPAKTHILPVPLRSFSVDEMSKKLTDFADFADNQENDGRFYGAGAYSFSDAEPAIRFFESCRENLSSYFDREGFNLDYLNFTLLLIRTTDGFRKPLLVKPHTIVRQHLEEAVEDSATSIIWVSEDSYLN